MKPAFRILVDGRSKPNTDNPKASVKDTHKYGKGLFAEEKISKNETIADFDGPIYQAKSCSDLPSDIRDHAVQISENTWTDSLGFARYLNHSCEPNCGVTGSATIVAMRDIFPGEELVFDYDMTEDSDWRMHCLCSCKTCRHEIGAFGLLPRERQLKLGKYVSEYLKKKYKL